MGPEAAVVEAVETHIDNVSPETAEVSEVQAPTKSRSERINALHGKAKDHYRMTGDVDAAEKLMTPKASSEEASSEETQPAAAEAAETEAAPGTAKPEQQPTTRTKQDRNFREVTKRADAAERENIALKARLDVYERERAANRPSAPVTTKTEAKPVASDDPRPEFPDINNFDDPKDFNKAVKDWQKADSEWVDRRLDNRFNGEKQKSEAQQFNQKWTSQIDDARKVHKDYDQVVFNGNVPLSYATMTAIQSMPDGALRSYAVAKNLELATRIAELTFIEGEEKYESPAEFLKWVKSDPDRAMLYGEKLALAKAELAKLSVSTKAAPQPKPLKEVIRSTPKPSAEVNTEVEAAPVLDPIAQALKNKDFKTYKRLMNEKELRERKAN